MRMLLMMAAALLGTMGARAAEVGAPQLPAQVDGFIVAPVGPDSLGKKIQAAQDGKETSFTIAMDGGAAEPLGVSQVRLRDYQNVYYRVTGQAGAWRLEEQGFSPSGEDEMSRLIRRALGVPAEKKVFFLPGRLHLVVPARSRVLLQAGNDKWDFVAQRVGTGTTARRGVLVRAGQGIPLLLGETVSTATAKKGTAVSFTVSEDVSGDGLTAITKGTPVEATVLHVQRPGWLGEPGRIVLELKSTKAVDGSEVPLRNTTCSRLCFTGNSGFLFLRAGNLELRAGATVRARAAKTVAVLAPVAGK